MYGLSTPVAAAKPSKIQSRKQVKSRRSAFFPTTKAVEEISRKVMKSVRKSIGGDERLKHRTNSERELHEAYDRAQEAARDPKTSPAMKFDSNGAHGQCEKVRQFFLARKVDKNMSALGGMVALHQYCVQKFMATGESVYRDGANFFRSADPECFSMNDIIPIRMAFMGLYSMQTVEPWYRDYYTNIGQDRLLDKQYNPDRHTKYDQFFIDNGINAYLMVEQEMSQMEGACSTWYAQDGKQEDALGIEFWRKTTVCQLPRNYQLLLAFANKEQWPISGVERLFRMLYKMDLFRGARGIDVYN